MFYYQAVLKKEKIINKDIKHLFFSLKKEVAFYFIPGQFITIYFSCSGENFSRNYSIANYCTQEKTIEIVCKCSGKSRSGNLLFNLLPGNNISFTGPHGTFAFLEKGIFFRHILVATGVSIVTYRSMLNQIENYIKKNMDSKKKVILLLGIKNNNSFLFKEEFNTINKKYPNHFEMLICYSQQKDSYSFSSFERFGYVQNFFKELKVSPLGDIVYLCGKEKMVRDSLITLKKLGFEKDNIIL